MTKPPLRSPRGTACVLLALVALVAACGPATKAKLEAIVAPDGPVIESLEGAGGKKGGAPAGGEVVTIKGKNFPAQADCAVRFGEKRNKEKDLEKATPTEIVLKVPENLPPGETLDVSVEKRDEDDKVVARAVLKDSWTVSGFSIRHVIVVGCLIGIFSMLGGPIFVVLAAITLLGTFYEKQGLAGFSLVDQAGSTVFGNFFDKVAESPLFIAIPLFTFAGTIMAESKTPQRLVDFARALFGWVPGGVALVALITCSFFTAFTGASGVTIIALGGLLYPVLRKDKYDERFSLGLLTTCGSLGLLFKPALPVYIYGIIAKVDADRVFTAALIPGVLLVVVLFIYSAFNAWRTNVQRAPFSVAELWRSFRAALWELPIVPIVLGGLYSGWFTAAEASAVTAFYAFVVQVFVYRDIKFRDVPRVIKSSMVLVGAIIMILAVALGFMGWLTNLQVPQMVLALMQERVHSANMFLLMLNVFLLIVGCVMEGYTATLVVVPLIAPIALQYGIDPYHLAVIFLLNLEIAYSLPPVGFNLFLSALRFGKPLVALYRPAMEFVIVMVVVLAAVTYFPQVSLCLFDVPGMTVKGERTLDVTQGEEKKIEIAVTEGGVDLATAEKRLAEADAAFKAEEAKQGATWADLKKKREDSKTADPAVAAKISALEPSFEKRKDAEQLVTAIKSLGDGAEWRSSLEPEMSQKGLTFSTTDLKPGQHEITVTAQDVHAHVTQTKLIIRVAPKK